MQYKIAVSGAAVTNHCCGNIILISKEVGREIARSHCVLVSGRPRACLIFRRRLQGSRRIQCRFFTGWIRDWTYQALSFAGWCFWRNDLYRIGLSRTRYHYDQIRRRGNHYLRAWEPCTNLPPPSNVKNQSAFCLDPAVPPTKSLIWSREHSGVWKITYDTDPIALVRNIIEQVHQEKTKENKTRQTVKIEK